MSLRRTFPATKCHNGRMSLQPNVLQWIIPRRIVLLLLFLQPYSSYNKQEIYKTVSTKCKKLTFAQSCSVCYQIFVFYSTNKNSWKCWEPDCIIQVNEYLYRLHTQRKVRTRNRLVLFFMIGFSPNVTML